MNKKAVQAMQDFLEAVGVDLKASGMEKTPERVAGMYEYLFNGINATTEDVWGELFKVENEGIVAVRPFLPSTTLMPCTANTPSNDTDAIALTFESGLSISLSILGAIFILYILPFTDPLIFLRSPTYPRFRPLTVLPLVLPNF